MPDLLIELFSEEIPARMQKRASEDLQKLVDAAMSHWGRVDVLVNSAGHGPRAPILELTDEDWHEGMEVYFLNAVRHRSAIPGGTCEFDLPVYSHWLRQPYERRQQDMQEWLGAVRPVCDAVIEVLWLIRESGEPRDKSAINGMYQHNMQKDANCRLLRVSVDEGSSLFPEISGSQHRFTVRFLEWSSVDSRAVQTGHDVPFRLSIC